MSALRPTAVSLLVTLVALGAAGVFGGRQQGATAPFLPPLEAGSTGIFHDADGDLVPQCLEILANTSEALADTDSDGIDDFEEILTFTSQDPSAEPRPVDTAMRVLVTSTPRPAGGTDVYLHLMVRFVNLCSEEIAFHEIYAAVGNVEVPLIPYLGYGEVRVSGRNRERDGQSFLISMRISSVEDLLWFMPCTIGVRAVMGGRMIDTGTLLVADGPELAALLPYEQESMILQPVSTAVAIQDANPYYRGGGRVCELGLTTIGSSPGGALCLVDWAKCRAAAGLRCSTSCSGRAGSTVVIPGGLGTILGGR